MEGFAEGSLEGIVDGNELGPRDGISLGGIINFRNSVKLSFPFLSSSNLSNLLVGL